MNIRNTSMFIVCLFLGGMAFEKSYYLDDSRARVDRCFRLIDEQASIIKSAHDNVEKYKKLAHDWESVAGTLASEMDSMKMCTGRNAHTYHANEVIIGN